MANQPDYPNYPALNANPTWQTGHAGGYFGMPGQVNDPRAGIANYYQQAFNRNPGMDTYRKYLGATDGMVARNPFSFQQRVNNDYRNFMLNNGGYNYQLSMDDAYRQANLGAYKYNQALDGMRSGMSDKNSVALAQGRAQQQQTMADIAQQAAMQGGGQYNPAIARTALMQQSQVGQNMAAQIAAARAQERQQQQMAYMQAMQGGVQNYGNLYGLANQAYTGAQNTFGALANIGYQGHSQATSAVNQNEQLAKNVR